jgi:hypothetical protein
VCHGQQWPQPAQAVGFQHPVALVGAHADVACSQCHQGAAQLDIEDCASCHQAPEATHFGPDCASCHTPEGWVESAASRVSAAPDNPHGIETIDCLVCHEAGGVQPEPADHQGIPSVSCVRCHETTFVARVPGIPHAVEVGARCLACHDRDRVIPEPASHTGWPEASCLLCHEPSAAQ